MDINAWQADREYPFLSECCLFLLFSLFFLIFNHGYCQDLAYKKVDFYMAQMAELIDSFPEIDDGPSESRLEGVRFFKETKPFLLKSLVISDNFDVEPVSQQFGLENISIFKIRSAMKRSKAATSRIDFHKSHSPKKHPAIL